MNEEKYLDVMVGEDEDVLKTIIKKAMDAKGVDFNYLLEKARNDYKDTNSCVLFISPGKMTTKVFRTICKVLDLNIEVLVSDKDDANNKMNCVIRFTE